jgi:hypothetical protein
MDEDDRIAVHVDHIRALSLRGSECVLQARMYTTAGDDEHVAFKPAPFIRRESSA